MSDIDLTDGAKKKEEEIVRLRRQRELNDIRTVVASAEGRRLLWKIIAESGVFRKSYRGENNATNFNEGRRSVGNNLFNDLIEAKPEAFLQMQRENAALSKQEQRDQMPEEKS